MGAWDTGVFDNDSALDWVAELEESSGTELLQRTLDLDDMEDRYLEAPQGEEILAAAEVIAALRGRPAPKLPAEVERWVAQNRGLDVTTLTAKAIELVDSVLSENSELNELWAAEPEHPVWKANALDLRARLAGLD